MKNKVEPKLFSEVLNYFWCWIHLFLFLNMNMCSSGIFTGPWCIVSMWLCDSVWLWLSFNFLHAPICLCKWCITKWKLIQVNSGSASHGTYFQLILSSSSPRRNIGWWSFYSLLPSMKLLPNSKGQPLHNSWFSIRILALNALSSLQ